MITLICQVKVAVTITVTQTIYISMVIVTTTMTRRKSKQINQHNLLMFTVVAVNTANQNQRNILIHMITPIPITFAQTLNKRKKKLIRTTIVIRITNAKNTRLQISLMFLLAVSTI